METKITGIEWLEETKMRFSWTVKCKPGERPDDHYCLLYKPLSDCNAAESVLPLRPDSPGVRRADLFCNLTGVDKSRTLRLDGVGGQIVAFTVYPCLYGTRTPCLDVEASGCAFVGAQSAVKVSVINNTDGSTSVSLRSDCALRRGDILLYVRGEEYEFPLSMDYAKECTAVFLSELRKGEIEPRLSGEARWKCKLVQED